MPSSRSLVGGWLGAMRDIAVVALCTVASWAMGIATVIFAVRLVALSGDHTGLVMASIFGPLSLAVVGVRWLDSAREAALQRLQETGSPPAPMTTKPIYTPAMKHLLPKAIEPKPATKPKPKPKPKRKKRPHRGDHVTYLKGRYAPTGVYLDECIGSSIARQLRERGVAAQHAHELGHRGWPDARHLDYAACKRLIVITRDRDFLALHEDGEPHSGILFGATVPGIEADLYAAALEALKP